jgi:hypothetical protein
MRKTCINTFCLSITQKTKNGTNITTTNINECKKNTKQPNIKNFAPTYYTNPQNVAHVWSNKPNSYTQLNIKQKTKKSALITSKYT